MLDAHRARPTWRELRLLAGLASDCVAALLEKRVKWVRDLIRLPPPTERERVAAAPLPPVMLHKRRDRWSERFKAPKLEPSHHWLPKLQATRL